MHPRDRRSFEPAVTNSAPSDAKLRPTPIEEGWRDRPLDGRLAIQIFAYDGEEASETAWVQSTRWLDPVAKR